jgi:hypothetical protein
MFLLLDVICASCCQHAVIAHVAAVEKGVDDVSHNKFSLHCHWVGFGAATSMLLLLLLQLLPELLF